ncbi:MAG: CopG family antitoxin [Coriobacteriia bacterium]|nr:CopG family antitoxin [Coriobacteriia bacterium]MCL2870377.1 CopG family antitoxin [Coriobacteriia bacterium]
MNEVKLDSFEQSIEDAAEQFVPLEGEEKERLEATLAEIKRNKNKSINIRISQYDLDRVKERSQREGVPYQTLISSIIHRYLEGTLVDEEAVLHAARLLKD